MKIFPKFILFLLIITNLYSNSIKVAVAANMSYAIPTVIKQFNKQYPNIKVDTILGSSGKLTSQIYYKAPYDIFLSANLFYPKQLYKKGLTLNKPIIYAYGKLAIITNKNIDIKKWKQLIVTNSIKKIAVANPKTAPYGIATKEVLDNLHLYNKLKPKFIYGESISQTVTYASKVTDIGFVAYSSLFSPYMKKFLNKKYHTIIDTKLYNPIAQGVVILKNSKNKEDAKIFFDFLQSKNAKKIFLQYGYTI